MNFDHPTIVIESPAPGHYLIKGHNPRPVLIEDVGHVVPPGEVYISPEVPTEALLAIIEARGDSAKPDTGDLLSRVKAACADKAVQLKALAEHLGVEPAEIAALEGDEITIGDTGPKWVKLKNEGGAE